jgi:hypothetical protein
MTDHLFGTFRPDLAGYLEKGTQFLHVSPLLNDNPGESTSIAGLVPPSS